MTVANNHAPKFIDRGGHYDMNASAVLLMLSHWAFDPAETTPKIAATLHRVFDAAAAKGWRGTDLFLSACLHDKTRTLAHQCAEVAALLGDAELFELILASEGEVSDD